MKKFLCIIIIAFILISPCGIIFAADDTTSQTSPTSQALLDELYDQTGLDALSQFSSGYDLYSLTGYHNLKDFFSAVITGEYAFSFESFFTLIKDLLIGEFQSYISIIINIMILCVLCSLVNIMGSSFLSQRIGDAAFYAVYFALSVLLVNIFFQSIKSCTAIIDSLIEFMNILVPVLLVLLSTTGGVLTASLMSPALLFFTNLVTYLINSFIIPVTCFGFVLSIVDNVMSGINISYFTKFIKKASAFLLGISFVVFMGIVSIEGLTFTSIDGIGVKAAKYAVSNLVPVVGKFLSDSADTVTGFILIIKNTVGLFGVLIVIAITLIPVLKLFAMFLALRFSAILVQPFADSRISGVVDSAASSMFFVTSCMAVIGVMFIIMIAMLIMMGNAILSLR